MKAEQFARYVTCFYDPEDESFESSYDEYKERDDPYDVLYRAMLLLADPLRYFNMPYYDYLETDYWKLVRQAVILKRGLLCQHCRRISNRNRPLGIEIHHIDYRNRGDEFRNLDCLVILCHECHRKWHGLPAEAS